MMQRKKEIFTIYRNNSGFSLMELMVVVAIIGILATVAMNSFITTRERVGDSAAFSETNAMGKAIVNAFLDEIDVDFFHLEGHGPEIGATRKSDGGARAPVYTLGNGLKAIVVGDSNLGQCVGTVWYGDSAKTYTFIIDVEAGSSSFPTS